MTGNEIKQLRERTGLNQTQFAQIFAVSPSLVNCWEKGTRNPPQLYEANMIRLNDKLNGLDFDNKEIKDIILKLLLVTGLVGFLMWVFKD